MNLSLDEEGLASCVSCGLCLPHCPTFRVTGDESRSPRGRIQAMRAVSAGLAPLDEDFVGAMESCVQCLGCETACPSSVPFGRLMSQVREHLVRRRRLGSVPTRLAYRALGSRRLVRAGAMVLAGLQRLRLIPSRRLGLPPRLPLRQRPLVATGTDVWLHTGCVMDAIQREVHRSAVAVLGAGGFGVELPGAGAACCGALHHHAGFGSDARRLAERTMAAFPGDAPILVDAAGCGAMLKDYGHLLATPEAHRFAARVRDVHEWLAEHLDRLPGARVGTRPRVSVQDPCHLRHAQRRHHTVRKVLEPYAELIEPDDEGLCCGAGGAYWLVQPELAGRIRDRKVAALQRAGAFCVISANPGCSLFLAAAGLDVRHPLQVLEEAIRAH